MDKEDHIYIEAMAEKLGRAVHTLRQWIREEALPAKLMPKREGGRQKIYWTPSQVEPLIKWANQRSARRGWQSAA